MARLIALLLGVPVLLGACQGSEEPGDPMLDAEPPVADDVLARYAGGEISIADVDARILGLPAAERLAPGNRIDAWYEGLIREIAVERLLLEQAAQLGVARNQDFRSLQTTMGRQLSVQACLAEAEPSALQVSDDELEQAYGERGDRFRAPERRAAYHIYLRRGAGERIEDLETEMRALRERILRGESFRRLAEAESDSESRHRQGSIGWVRPGQLPPALEELVFSLDEGVPSQPLATADGVHLFQVDDVLPERRLSRQEALPLLSEQLRSERLAAAIDELAAQNASPTASIAAREDLERWIETGAEQEIVLLGEGYSLSLQDLRERLRTVLAREDGVLESLGGRVPTDVAWQFLNRLFRQELAYEYCREEALFSAESVAARLSDWQERALINEMRQRLLREQALEDREQLELYYQSNVGQYTPPVEWNLRRLSLPLDGPQEARRRMARLEAAAGDAGMSLEAVQQELGGEIETPGWTTLEQMRRISPKLAPLVSSATQGALVSPLRIRDRLHLYEVRERREFGPKPFEEVLEAVVSAYLRQYTSEIYGRVESELLERAGFELYPDRLDRLREVAAPEPGITVEQLEALLSES